MTLDDTSSVACGGPALACLTRADLQVATGCASRAVVITVEMTRMLASKRVLSRDAARALDLESRIKLEEQITDAKASKIDVPTIPDTWTFSDYSEEYPWRSYEFNFLGPLAGKSILDLGCGYHPTPIYFALAGAERVCACDVSPKAVQFMRRVAAIYGVADRVTVYESPAEELPFRSGEFDLMHGEAVLHHISLPAAAPEIRRVLKPGGRAVFKDPLGHNPVLEFVRDHMPAITGKSAAKGTDRPLTIDDVEGFGNRFASYEYRTFGLSSMMAMLMRLPERSLATRALHAVDRAVLEQVSFMRRYAQYVVACVTA
jgi:SAM-dependent methyltransferase